MCVLLRHALGSQIQRVICMPTVRKGETKRSQLCWSAAGCSPFKKNESPRQAGATCLWYLGKDTVPGLGYGGCAAGVVV